MLYFIKYTVKLFTAGDKALRGGMVLSLIGYIKKREFVKGASKALFFVMMKMVMS